MRILVAGDRGYIGAVLVPFLQGHGHDVVGLDAEWYESCDFGPAPAPYERRRGDIRDVKPDELEGLDAVVNLAAISNDPVGHLKPAATFSVNADGRDPPCRGHEAGWRSALSVLVIMLPVRRSR